ncbi:HAD family hydrolase [Glycomyces salinus]|uniref:HAD family hydrolase n=1 Tax=Glycomyces salinus TaxID=980294 RepID=UPI0018EC1C3B|nr:HAD-IA family hydrolase [Glycomyces salinus]
MRGLYDTPAAYRIDEAQAAAPVPPVEAVLFDFSNTLFRMIDARMWLRRVAAATGRAAETEREDFFEDTIAQIEQTGALPEVAAAQAGRDLDPRRHWEATFEWWRRVDFLRGRERAAYEQLSAPDAWVPYADTEPVLRELARRGLPVAIVSDFAWDLGVHLKHFGLDDLVAARILSYEVGAEKPSPEIFRAACDRLGVDPRAALMVGDNPARDGGAASIGARAYILPAEQRTGERGLRHVLGFLDRDED